MVAVSLVLVAVGKYYDKFLSGLLDYAPRKGFLIATSSGRHMKNPAGTICCNMCTETSVG